MAWALRFVFLLLVSVSAPVLASAQPSTAPTGPSPVYLIGPGDQLQIFVWQNPELSVTIPVRPDGRISTPLAPDVVAAGRTPTELAAALRTTLSQYVRDPTVTVLVTNVVGPVSSHIRIVGQAVTPKSIPFRDGLTVLDVLIESGGLTTFAAGNRAVLMRTAGGETQNYNLRLNDLLRDGDLSANVDLMPGDIIRIPERWF